MRSSRKILISSIVLIAIGILGLIVVSVVGNIGTGISNFGTGQGYAFSSEDLNHMSRDFFQSRETVDLDFEEVENLTKEYLKSSNLEDLEIAEIMEFSKNYYIEVTEINTGIGAMELLVDKSSGAVFPEYGPNMMWNLKYGMHGNASSAQDSMSMPITKDEAIKLSEKYLAKSNIGEFTSDDVEIFYGYYTIHTLDENGEIAGMLSVNGYSGDVWYHSWHGVFVDMTEEH
jgi:hypothetical protein